MRYYASYAYTDAEGRIGFGGLAFTSDEPVQPQILAGLCQQVGATNAYQSVTILCWQAFEEPPKILTPGQFLRQ